MAKKHPARNIPILPLVGVGMLLTLAVTVATFQTTNYDTRSRAQTVYNPTKTPTPICKPDGTSGACDSLVCCTQKNPIAGSTFYCQCGVSIPSVTPVRTSTPTSSPTKAPNQNCSPGARSCVQWSVSWQVQECNASGMSWNIVQTCPGACSNGACVTPSPTSAAICTPNTTRCGSTFGTLGVEICNPGGLSWRLLTACSYSCSNGMCIQSPSSTPKQVCTPLAKKCYIDSLSEGVWTVLQCQFDGARWNSFQTCPPGSGCVNGACYGNITATPAQNQICAPNTTRCGSTFGTLGVEICNPGGLSWKLLTACSYSCSNGVCLSAPTRTPTPRPSPTPTKIVIAPGSNTTCPANTVKNCVSQGSFSYCTCDPIPATPTIRNPFTAGSVGTGMISFTPTPTKTPVVESIGNSITAALNTVFQMNSPSQTSNPSQTAPGQTEDQQVLSPLAAVGSVVTNTINLFVNTLFGTQLPTLSGQNGGMTTSGSTSEFFQCNDNGITVANNNCCSNDIRCWNAPVIGPTCFGLRKDPTCVNEVPAPTAFVTQIPREPTLTPWPSPTNATAGSLSQQQTVDGCTDIACCLNGICCSIYVDPASGVSIQQYCDTTTNTCSYNNSQCFSQSGGTLYVANNSEESDAPDFSLTNITTVCRKFLNSNTNSYWGGCINDVGECIVVDNEYTGECLPNKTCSISGEPCGDNRLIPTPYPTVVILPFDGGGGINIEEAVYQCNWYYTDQEHPILVGYFGYPPDYDPKMYPVKTDNWAFDSDCGDNAEYKGWASDGQCREYNKLGKCIDEVMNVKCCKCNNDLVNGYCY